MSRDTYIVLCKIIIHVFLSVYNLYFNGINLWGWTTVYVTLPILFLSSFRIETRSRTHAAKPTVPPDTKPFYCGSAPRGALPRVLHFIFVQMRGSTRWWNTRRFFRGFPVSVFLAFLCPRHPRVRPRSRNFPWFVTARTFVDISSTTRDRDPSAVAIAVFIIDTAINACLHIASTRDARTEDCFRAFFPGLSSAVGALAYVN